MFSILGSICIGDKTSCGGTVATGSEFCQVNGRSIARQGDKIACEKNCAIVGGNSKELIAGAAMALHGAQTSGGCICLSQNNDYHGDGNSPTSADAVALAVDAGIAFMPDMAKLLSEDHWIEFQLSDGYGQAIPHQTFSLVDSSGKQFTGKLDEKGFARVEPVKAGQCKVNFPELNHSVDVESCPR